MVYSNLLFKGFNSSFGFLQEFPLYFWLLRWCYQSVWCKERPVSEVCISGCCDGVIRVFDEKRGQCLRYVFLVVTMVNPLFCQFQHAMLHNHVTLLNQWERALYCSYVTTWWCTITWRSWTNESAHYIATCYNVMDHYHVTLLNQWECAL
jgi:hypothetical protein